MRGQTEPQTVTYNDYVTMYLQLYLQFVSVSSVCHIFLQQTSLTLIPSNSMFEDKLRYANTVRH